VLTPPTAASGASIVKNPPFVAAAEFSAADAAGTVSRLATADP
jgi:hypothetical protein